MAAYFWACSSLASILPEAFCGPLEIKFAGFIRNGVWPNSVVLVEGLWDLIKKPESRYKRDLGPEGCRFELRCSEHGTDPHCSQVKKLKKLPTVPFGDGLNLSSLFFPFL